MNRHTLIKKIKITISQLKELSSIIKSNDSNTLDSFILFYSSLSIALDSDESINLKNAISLFNEKEVEAQILLKQYGLK